MDPRASMLCVRGLTMKMTEVFKSSVVVSEVEFYATTGKIAKLQAALDRGGNANARDRDGYSALHGAAENGHAACVRLLLDRGARANAATRDGVTPIELAESSGHPGVIDLLTQRLGW
jgi:ankyrin repeat protein